jgi:integrase
MSLDAARGAAREAREQAAQGIDPRRGRPRRHLAKSPQSLSAAAVGGEYAIETLVHDFLERQVKPNRKRPEYAQRIIQNEVLRAWAGRDVRTITPREAAELYRPILARGSKTMANRVDGIVKQLFRYAVNQGLVDSSPVALLYRPGGKERSRDRALDDVEITALLHCIDDVMRSPRMVHAVKILLATGQRRGELALARWRDIDFTGKTWLIPAEHSKTGAAHTVPLSDFALHEFERLKVAAVPRAQFVFPSEGNTAPIDPKLITRVVARNQKSFKEHEIAAFTAHDLRRTVRTGLAKLEIENDIAERVLAHKLPGMRGVYDRHDYLPEMRIALDKWATYLDTLRGV